jgi:predicted phage-related endonuclease
MKPKIHDLEQGSQKWLEFRLNHNGSSEIAAAMGLSPDMTRREMLKVKSTGLSKEFSDYVQKYILDKGHEIEAKTRDIIEKQFGIELYPTVASKGNISASADGITFENDLAWECKSYNKVDFDLVMAGELPPKHMPQCQQVMGVFGIKRLLFTISDGVNNTASLYVDFDEDYWDKIKETWAQFDEDKKVFKAEASKALPVANEVIGFPAITYKLNGTLIVSDLSFYKDQAVSLKERYLVPPRKDQDFADRHAQNKEIKEAEERIQAVRKNVTGEFSDLSAFIKSLDEIETILRSTRLIGEKQVKEGKDQIKLELVSKYRADWLKFYGTKQSEIAPIKLICNEPDFKKAIANKRSIDGCEEGLSTEVANAKIAATTLVKEIKQKQIWLDEKADGHLFLLNDLQTIIYKPFDDFTLLINTRIEKHEHEQFVRAEQERELIRKQEESKAIAAQAALSQQLIENALREEREKQSAAKAAEFLRRTDGELPETPIGSALNKSVTVVEKHPQDDANYALFDPMQSRGRLFEAQERAAIQQENEASIVAPSRQQLIEAIAKVFFDVKPSVAEKWLIDTFRNG